MAGNVREAKSGEPLVGAVVYIENPWIGVATDAFGYYSINLPKGRNELKIQSIGMRNTLRQIILYSDGNLDIEMIEHVIPLKEVVIEAEKDVNEDVIDDSIVDPVETHAMPVEAVDEPAEVVEDVTENADTGTPAEAETQSQVAKGDLEGEEKIETKKTTN